MKVYKNESKILYSKNIQAQISFANIIWIILHVKEIPFAFRQCKDRRIVYIYNICMYSLKHFTFNSFAEMQICRVNLKIRKMLRYKRCYKT